MPPTPRAAPRIVTLVRPVRAAPYVLGGLDLLRSVGQRAEGKRRVGLFNRQRSRRLTAGVALLQHDLPGAHMHAAVLRNQMWLHMRGFLMAAERTALIAVWVSFAGKPGPHRAGHRAKGFKFHTKTGQLRRTGYAVVNGIHPQCALCFHGVDQLCAGPRHSGDAKLELHLYAVGTCFQHLHAVICYKHIRRHPGRRSQREAASAVIVGGGAPERRARCAPEPLAAVDVQR